MPSLRARWSSWLRLRPGSMASTSSAGRASIIRVRAAKALVQSPMVDDAAVRYVELCSALAPFTDSAESASGVRSDEG